MEVEVIVEVFDSEGNFLKVKRVIIEDETSIEEFYNYDFYQEILVRASECYIFVNQKRVSSKYKLKNLDFIQIQKEK